MAGRRGHGQLRIDPVAIGARRQAGDIGVGRPKTGLNQKPAGLGRGRMHGCRCDCAATRRPAQTASTPTATAGAQRRAARGQRRDHGGAFSPTHDLVDKASVPARRAAGVVKQCLDGNAHTCPGLDARPAEGLGYERETCVMQSRKRGIHHGALPLRANPGFIDFHALLRLNAPHDHPVQTPLFHGSPAALRP